MQLNAIGRLKCFLGKKELEVVVNGLHIQISTIVLWYGILVRVKPNEK